MSTRDNMRRNGTNPLFCARVDPALADWLRVRALRNSRQVARELELILRDARKRDIVSAEREIGGGELEAGG